jgi:flagellar biosynthesis/type III secretory pathway chaperone
MIQLTDNEQLETQLAVNQNLKDCIKRERETIEQLDAENWKLQQIIFDMKYPGVIQKLKKCPLLGSLITI